jgi:energy-coupling factor transport system substrate-specific component
MNSSLRQSFSLTTRDIVTIAILSSLGGALSTFVGYLGNLINLALGVPFGAGQFMAGLHVFWIVLMRILVPKTGVGTAGGLLKGMVEMVTGSTHGVVILLVSLVQGAIVDFGASLVRNDDGLGSRLVWWISAGISAATNVIVFQVLYFTGTATWYILYIVVLTLLAFSSGVIFAGYFAWETFEFLSDAGVTTNLIGSSDSGTSTLRRVSYRNLPAIAFIIFLVVGSAYYTTNVANLFGDPDSCEVRGLVENPFVFSLSDFSDQQVTIEAELIGAYTHLQPANYTGPLIGTILSTANLLPQATGLRVIARDGYTVEFDDINAVLADSRFLLTEATDGLWLIAGDYDGSLWVRMVSTLEVY